MRRLAAYTTAVAVAVLAIAGCGGGKTQTTGSSASLPTTTASRQTTPALLEQAVRSALTLNGQLSLYVLRNNEIPSWASQSTGGPALSALAASASARRKQGVTVQTISEQFRVLAISLEPSYTVATATVEDRQRLAVHEHGRKRTTTLTERDHVVLHRLGQTTRFVVWKVQQV